MEGPPTYKFLNDIKKHERKKKQKKTSRYCTVMSCLIITYSKSKDQPDKVANLARGQLSKEN